MVAVRSVLALALATVGIAHKEHDGLRGEQAGLKHEQWVAKYMSWLRGALAEQNVKLEGSWRHDSESQSQSIDVEVEGSMAKVKCSAKEGAAASDKAVLTFKYEERFV
jgi:hypothetical protein